MLKEINGRTFMTGTSAGSLYPVALMHPASRLMLGIRLEIVPPAKTGQTGIFAMALYARLQKFDAEGNTLPLTSDELFECVPNMQLRIASPTHMSGFLMQGGFNANQLEDKTHEGVSKKFAEAYVEILKKIQENHVKNMVLADEKELFEAARERYMKVVVGVEDEASLEQQLGDSSSFDFKALLGKPDASDAK